jgi:Tfp pilus assembly protein PilN
VGACFSGLGLGTYTTNLLPHKSEFRINKIAPLATKIFLALIFVMVIGIVVTDSVKQKNHLTLMEKAFSENEPEVKVLEKKVAAINRLEKRYAFLQEIKDNEFFLDILAELTRVIPVDSWVSNLNFKGIEINSKKPGGELIINGFAESSSSLISLLEDSPFFEKVEFVGPIKKTKEKEQFKLSARIVRPGNKTNTAEQKDQ